MRTLRLQVRGQRRRIGIREHVPGFEHVQHAVRDSVPDLRVREEFSYWRTWLPFAGLAINIFNGALQLVVRGYFRRDLSGIETVIWSVLLLASSGVAVWFVLLVRRTRQASH
jgi:hypothetical protein